MKEVLRIKYKGNDGNYKEFVINDSDLIFGSGVGITLAGIAIKSPELTGVGVGLAGTGLLIRSVPSPSEELDQYRNERYEELLSDLEELDNKDKEE